MKQWIKKGTALLMGCFLVMLFVYTSQGQVNAASITETNQSGVTQSTQFISPPAIVVQATKGNQVNISFTPVSGAKNYILEKSSSSETGYQKLATLAAGTTSYTDTKVKTGKYYYYRLSVSPETGYTQTAEYSVGRAYLLQTPTLSKVSADGQNQLSIRWNKVGGSTGYEVYRATSKRGQYTLIGTIEGKDNLLFQDGTVIPGKNFYYKIRAVKALDQVNQYSASSLALRGRTIAPVSITSVVGKNSTAMTIRWTQSRGANAYELYRSTKQDTNYKKIKTISGNTNNYTDTKVKQGKTYYYKVKAITTVDGKKVSSAYSVYSLGATLNKVKIKAVSLTATNTLLVSWKKVTGAEQYKVYRATSKTGNYKEIATVDGATYSFADQGVKAQRNYYYKVRAQTISTGVTVSGTPSDAKKGMTMYTIMGNTSVTAAQMVALYNQSGRTYPSATYASKGAANIEQFVQIVLEESAAEGVKAEVIFVQMALETGYLSFGYQVSAEQCNFSGLGATDDGAAGATFPDVRTGIRAQVQHMKGYASKEALNQTCVDPRFHLLGSRRGSCPYVEQLGNGNWATDPLYASKLMTMMRKMKSY